MMSDHEVALVKSEITTYFNKLYFCPCDSLGMFGSDFTRIPEW